MLHGLVQTRGNGEATESEISGGTATTDSSMSPVTHSLGFKSHSSVSEADSWGSNDNSAVTRSERVHSGDRSKPLDYRSNLQWPTAQPTPFIDFTATVPLSDSLDFALPRHCSDSEHASATPFNLWGSGVVSAPSHGSPTTP